MHVIIVLLVIKNITVRVAIDLDVTRIVCSSLLSVCISVPISLIEITWRRHSVGSEWHTPLRYQRRTLKARETDLNTCLVKRGKLDAGGDLARKIAPGKETALITSA